MMILVVGASGAAGCLLVQQLLEQGASVRVEAPRSEYAVHVSPIRSAIFDAGVSRRINVSHFMAERLANDRTWQQWKGQMPVICDQQQSVSTASV